VDKLSLIGIGIGALSFLLGVYELSLRKKGPAVFFLGCALVFVAVVLHNEGYPDRSAQRDRSTHSEEFPAFSTSAPSQSVPSVSSVPEPSEAVRSASAAYRLDPDLVNVVFHDKGGPTPRPISAQATAQYLRELLERYNFNLVTALAAYDAGVERVEQCNCVPPETHEYVGRIVKAFNKEKSKQRVPKLEAQAIVPTPEDQKKPCPVKAESNRAVLSNGFTVQFERCEQVGASTRLYPSHDLSSFVNIPTVDIDHYE
jgi:hypothetical protein